ncbi:MAG: hypothetical protein ACLR8Y_05190 [Alistipes indistinctus]
MKPLCHRPRRATRRAARRPAEAVAPGIDRALLRDDLQAIRDTDLLFCYGEYEVYFASPEHIPHLMHEIGRLREITFREIGEGTKNDIDTDRYDRYYRQLFHLGRCGGTARRRPSPGLEATKSWSNTASRASTPIRCFA